MPYRIFGEISAIKLVPKALWGAFSVFGVNAQCQDAITYTYAQLQAHQRIENLVLITPKNAPMPLLNQIASAGCRIYCFVQAKQVDLQTYQEFAKVGIVIISKI